MEQFPSLLPEDETFETYHGFFRVQNCEFRIRVRFSAHNQNPTLSVSHDLVPLITSGVELHCDSELHQLLRPHLGVIQKRLLQNRTLHELLQDLTDVTESLLRSNLDVSTSLTSANSSSAMPSSQYYMRLLSDIDELGWNYVQDLNHSLSSLKIAVLDKAGREHSFQLHLSSAYPVSAPRLVADLPVPLQLKWQPQATLLTILHQFQQALDKYQDFWDVCDDFDNHLWVLEPDHPSRSIALRRFAIGNHCSIQVELNPLQPRALCECRFFGADSIIIPLREALNQKLHLWKEDLTPRQNLEQLLERSFPSATSRQNQDLSLECAICYAYKLDQAAPDRVCENPQCARPFHRVCLYEWLQSVPTTRQSFHTLFGHCPYCSTTITCSSLPS
eukprot:TRINITY_DN10370_c0_g1_i1.p1 TRINITY_DN10370_c0_g1~~TRINITY_DN10370_c0_g1_i1.p1  ORF type:complete len:389 (-),score=22.54 TRINITY_DN10370_c0_g1_i1:89-1255(-)